MRLRDHPVERLIAERTEEGSVPGQRRDPHKLGLVVEGGGMRGVVSAGMLTALEHLGLREVFDAVYGSSAGAVNAAYFLAGQAAYGTTIYYEDINNSWFMSMGRVFSRQPVVSLEYLLDDVAIRRKVLEWRKVCGSSVPLKVIAACILPAGSEMLDGFRDRDDLMNALRASSCIPFLAGGPVAFRGRLYLDPSAFESIPYESAARDGCTHVLVLRTRPKGLVHGEPAFVTKRILRRTLSALNPELWQAFRGKNKRYNALVARLERQTETGEGRPRALALALPRGAREVRLLERRRDVLIAAARGGFETVSRCLEEDQRSSPRPAPW